ncbi:hypothetical protein BTVI_53911 [Pitangus sulphuratus]|nr:hypothetical protein BTVI_53911 [Pitangus sulphuratus]
MPDHDMVAIYERVRMLVDKVRAKLERHVFYGWVSQWIRNQLDDYTQKAAVICSMSSWRPVTIDVPLETWTDMGLRKKFFTVRVVQHQKRLPREAGNVSSLKVSKARLNEALSNPV